MKSRFKAINIGSGRDIKKGWDNLDQHKKYGANIIWDLKNLPIKKIKSNTYDYVFCSHVLEDFVNPVPLIDELVRITKPGGRIEIRVPYLINVWDSIHHKRPFSILSFHDYAAYSKDTDYEKVRPVKLEKAEFYCPYRTSWMKFFCRLFNFLLRINKNAIDKTMLRYFGIGLSIKVIYKKV